MFRSAVKIGRRDARLSGGGVARGVFSELKRLRAVVIVQATSPYRVGRDIKEEPSWTTNWRGKVQT